MAKNEPLPSWVLKPEQTGEQIVVTRQPKAPAPAPEPGVLDTIGQYAGVANRALAPYATSAAIGGAAGAPFAGIGAIPGAAGGVLALGATDLATGLYNMAVPLFGGERIPLPSETIRRGYEKIGIGRRPQTATQQVFSDILEGAASGGGQARSAQTLEKLVLTPQGRNFMRFLGQNAGAQTAASAGGAAAPSIAANYFNVENPAALFGLSLGGSLAGGKAAMPKTKPIPAATLKTQASDLYKQMESEGVNVAPQAMSDLATQAQQRLASLKYDPDTDKVVTQALKLFQKKAGQPITFDMLEKFRRSIRDLPYSEGGGKRGTNEERAMVKALDDLVGDFMDNLTPGMTTAGDAAAATAFLKQARQTRAKAYQTETLESAIEAANLRSKQGDNPRAVGSALRTEFAKIVNNPRRLAKFDKPTQDAIKKVANGNFTRDALAAIGRVAPNARLFGLQIPFLGGLTYGGAVSPGTAALIGTAQLGAMGARGGANAMTKRAANAALISASGVKPGGKGWNLLSPATQQAILAQERGRQAAQRRDTFAAPSWVLRGAPAETNYPE